MAKTKQHKVNFATKAVHAGQHPEEITGAVTIPIFQTSTYSNKKLGETTGYDYARTANPTRTALQDCLAELENGKFAFCFSSGMSAVSAVINLFKSGDHIVCSDNVYGGTYRLYEQVMRKYGLDFTYVDTSDISLVENAIKPNTKMIYVETPTNPMLGISDLKKISALANNRKLISCVDNTFMSPYFQNPLDFGIDIVLHSSTKYINGHCDVIGGCVITSDESLAEQIKFLQNSIGAVPAPLDCFLILRALKTLPLRMKAHNSNAIAISEQLSRNRKVKKIFYPGLKSHPQHSIAKKQMRGFGGIISIDLGSYSAAKRFCNALNIFQIAESLGGVESLVCHPPSMTHGSVPKKMREKIGMNDGLVRLSVGIEDIHDLLNDIENALKKI
ncbi:MAG: PLP-dependent aspartate aminotransferase family protein [Ignavibacteria bacterium]|nr:PLP-dependent aspartate aminotransferase family protein [Ignavibacteria bacterium]